MLVAQHQFVAILRGYGWRASLIGTWTPDGRGGAVAPGGDRVSWVAPPDSDDLNEKGTWSSVWVQHATQLPSDAATALEVARLGEDVLTGPLGPQGRYRRRGLEVFLQRLGLTAVTAIREPYLVAGDRRIHLASGAVVAPDGSVRPRDLTLAPLAITDDPGLGRILAEAQRCSAPAASSARRGTHRRGSEPLAG